MGVFSEQNISDRIQIYERRWDIQVFKPFVRAPNYVAPARRRDGTPAVIKLGLSSDDEIRTEIEALRTYGGGGSAELLEADPDLAVLLMERLEPGTPLSTIEDDAKATRILASLMKQLWRPLPAGHLFPHIRDWARGMERYRACAREKGGPIPLSLIDTAQTFFDNLLSSMQPPVLVHGDLHHHNVLSAQRAPWLTIDPKGVAAEPAYETAAMLRNPSPGFLKQPRVTKLIERRIRLLADELGLDEERIWHWAFAQTVLSAVWDWEDRSGGWDYGIAMAEKLLQLKTG